MEQIDGGKEMTEAMVETIYTTLQVLGVFAFVAFVVWIVAQR